MRKGIWRTSKDELGMAMRIVPEMEMWVSVIEDHWRDEYAVKAPWNDVYKQAHNIPLGSIKMGNFDDVFRQGFVTRPLENFSNLYGEQICVTKGITMKIKGLND